MHREYLKTTALLQSTWSPNFFTISRT